MHFINSFITNVKAEKEKLIVSFSPKNRKLLAEKLKLRQLKKQIQSEIDVKIVALNNLNASLQDDKTRWLTGEILAVRYEIRKIQFEILQKREVLGELNEQEDLLNLKNYAG
jgi:hypothetical protein